MNEEQLLARMMRMQLQAESQNAAYGQLLRLLAGVVSGAIEPCRVLVNLTAQSWTLAPEGFRPESPATINGLPECVTAPPDAPPPPPAPTE